MTQPLSSSRRPLRQRRNLSSCPWCDRSGQILSAPKYIPSLRSTSKQRPQARWSRGLSGKVGCPRGKLHMSQPGGLLHTVMYPSAIRTSSGAPNEFSRGPIGGWKKLLQGQTAGSWGQVGGSRGAFAPRSGGEQFPPED